mmetsp:Transcript_96263/g.267437  ORF Transcript_96263/g.267437 Transcript_96263/m.267437 type:complete len:149 (+) Transcript_96263:1-447(+)
MHEACGRDGVAPYREADLSVFAREPPLAEDGSSLQPFGGDGGGVAVPASPSALQSWGVSPDTAEGDCGDDGDAILGAAQPLHAWGAAEGPGGEDLLEPEDEFSCDAASEEEEYEDACEDADLLGLGGDASGCENLADEYDDYEGEEEL